MPHTNPIVDGMKLCKNGHSYNFELFRCPECIRIRQKQYYKEKYQQNRAIFHSFKKGKKCKRCGFSDSRTLVYHHRDPSEKSFTVSHWLKHRYLGVKALKAEIRKCDLLCANCHMIEHS